ncbi:MAG: chemotaxis protein CheB [Deltaproteobacteria bacterium]|nr:chemotaxis protein CheB [Deltaproteobacteria bacterium]
MSAKKLRLDDTSQRRSFHCIVVGVSAGGMKALPAVLSSLPAAFPLPAVVVQHISPDGDNAFFVRHLNQRLSVTVKEAEEKEAIVPGHVYIAPPNYHLLIEKDRSFSLSIDEKVNYSRPSIDVLFESAADVYGPGLIGLILTGASSDGARGLMKIKENGGVALVQDPQSAEARIMPKAAIEACDVDYVLPLEEIGRLLVELGTKKGGHE